MSEENLNPVVYSKNVVEFVTVANEFCGAIEKVNELPAAESLKKLRWQHWRVIAFALISPPILAVPGVLVGLWLGLEPGTVVILGTLTASASYIAAPVAIRHAVPEADVGLTMLASLGVTFPFNVLVGIGLYSWLAENLGNLG